MFKGLHHQKIKKSKESGPKINYDFSKHVLIELLDDSTCESKIWSELGLTNNKNVVHKRIMIDSHRIKCRRAIVVCVNSEEAKLLARRLSQSMIMKRCICAVVIQDLLSDLCLFEKQIIQYGDNRPQQKLLYISDLNKCRVPSDLVKFLKEKFSPFGTILSVLVCPDDDGYAYPEGVIKFAYLSEAFAAELALDQNVIGKERLSVTTHHNILLSQCDLRVRLRGAQGCNAEPYTFSTSFHSNDDSVVNSIRNLQISSQNLESNSANMLFNNEFDKSELNGKTSEDIGTKEDSKTVSESGSFLSCDTNPYAHASHISAKIISSSFHSDDLSTISKYYSSSSMCCNQISSLQNVSENQRKFVASTSKKRRKHFTPSQKLCLKSQRICLTQNADESRTSKSEDLNLCNAASEGISSMQDETASLKFINWLANERETAKSESSSSTISYISTKNKNNLKLYGATSESMSPLQEEAPSLKVTNWLAHLPSSLNTTAIEQNYKKETVGSVTNKKKQKNQISVHNTPSLKLKSPCSNPDNSLIENEDPCGKTVILSKEDFQNGDQLYTPLQSWMKQELLLATNNSFIKSQETTKSVIVCAAKTKDVIISVGCSHMTCEICYPQSTDLLLGYS